MIMYGVHKVEFGTFSGCWCGTLPASHDCLGQLLTQPSGCVSDALLVTTETLLVPIQACPHVQ